MCTHVDKGWLIPTTILYKDRGNRKVPGCRCLKMKMGCLCSWYPGNGSRHQFVSISIKDVPTTPLYTYRSKMENGTTSSHNPSSAEVLEGRTIKTTPTCNVALISHCLNLSSLVFYHSVAVLVHELHSDSKCENWPLCWNDFPTERQALNWTRLKLLKFEKR
jgi:hypothetical protein